ncbi:MAG: DNA-binding domain-containing protein, partial [Acutalibacteraceae bacterium]
MITVTVSEAAVLLGRSKSCIKKYIQCGKLLASVDDEDPRHRYLIPIDALPETAQEKWYAQHEDRRPVLSEIRPKSKKTGLPMKTSLEDFTQQQRDQIEMWEHILSDWQMGRSSEQDKDAFDTKYIAKCKNKYPGIRISRDILYRRWRIYKTGNLSGLVDNRGQYRKGKRDIPKPIEDAFMYVYLSDDALPIAKCYEATRLMIRKDHPELLSAMPSIDTFYRIVQSLPVPVVTMARQGQKAFNDRCGVFVNRLYDDMASNDYWIADGHTIDVISKRDDGSDIRHRLTLSAFLDARSGIYTGWVVTDNPCADATLLALRKGIMRY